MISSNKMDDLHLAKNAMILFKSVCNGAGSSTGDKLDIGAQEALVRVSDYAMPFFEAGVGCYYANNLGEGCLSFLKIFFIGETASQSFIETSRIWTTIEFNKTYRYDRRKQISIASMDWGGTITRLSYTNGVKKVKKFKSFKRYSIACVANQSFSISDMISN